MTTAMETSLRAGLRRLAKAVVILTCVENGTRYAMAATAVSELSLDPPSMLICVNRTASLHAPLIAGADFGINILHGTHEDIAARCHGPVKGEARFAEARWIFENGDPPRLEDAQASFLCRQREQVAFGTHTIFIGEVTSCWTSAETDPLIYVDGRYTRAEPQPA